jgi:hypothetical protein
MPCSIYEINSSNSGIPSTNDVGDGESIVPVNLSVALANTHPVAG